MKLTFTIIASYQGGAPAGTQRSFDARDSVIGRGAQCDWILPDPLNHLSKKHCVISFAGTGFVVTDTSTNGVFLNEAPQQLGNGKSAALADGDRLVLGGYTLEAHLLQEAPPPPGRPVNLDDPFGISEFQMAAAPPSVPQPAVAAEPPLSFFNQPDAGGFPSDALIPEDFDLLGSDDLALGKPVSSPPSDWAGPMADNLPAEQAAFVPPRLEGGGVPDDWANDLLQPLPAAAQPPQPADDLLKTFLAAAGLPADALAGQDPAALMRALGTAYRAAVLGIADILRTRTMVKAEFRIEQTQIGAIGNNPLKFLSDPDAIVSAMVGRPTPGFQEANAALRDGLRDVQAHQLAVLAAMQAALAKLIAQFAPAQLMQRLERKSIMDAVLPGARKAKYWEVFEQSYKAIASELEEDFHGAFGRAFAEAYEEEMRRR